MLSGQRIALVAAAVAGIVAGVACTNSNSPPAASADAEPTSDKNGCKGESGGKHACTGAMADDKSSDAAKTAAPGTSAAPTMPPMDGMK